MSHVGGLKMDREEALEKRLAAVEADQAACAEMLRQMMGTLEKVFPDLAAKQQKLADLHLHFVESQGAFNEEIVRQQITILDRLGLSPEKASSLFIKLLRAVKNGRI